MDSNDFAYIESRLEIVLPTLFKSFMRQFPNDTAHQLYGAGDELQTNAELFVIAQLRRFNNDQEFDYYELQPELRVRHFLDIGGDGCGNFFCMVGDNSKSNELWKWDHDPYDGFTRCEDYELKEYFSCEWELAPQTDPFASSTSDGTYILRSDHPHRAILTPISIQQWREYVGNSINLELNETQEITDPFTNKTVTWRSWPGRAKLTAGDSWLYLSYHHGCLSLRTDNTLSIPFQSAMRRIAEDLNAHIC